MSKGLLFWVLMVIAFFFGGYTNRTALGVWVGNNLLLYVLLFLLGWAVFGPVIQ